MKFMSLIKTQFKLFWINLQKNEPTPNHPYSVNGLGELPMISVIAAMGVLVVSLSYAAARSGWESAMLLFWAGLVIIYAPIVARFLAPDITRSEGIGMILLLGIGAYLAKYLRHPLYFGGFDEFLHWRTGFDILQNKHLFTQNSLLTVSPLYPGLEIASTALSNLSGLSLFASGVIVVGVAKLVIMLGLYLLFEHISQSVSIAGLATAIYMGSSTFLFFDSAFGYESLALPIAIFSIHMLVFRSSIKGFARWVFNGLIVLAFFTIVATHHLTGYLLTALLLAWSIIDVIVRKKDEPVKNSFFFFLSLLALNAIWISSVATNTSSYLGPLITGSINSIYGFLTGQSAGRTLFANQAGQSAVAFERIPALAAVFFLGLGLLLGLWCWWRYHRRDVVLVLFALCASIYPTLPVMRLSSGAWEMSNRLSGFVFVALAYIVAMGIVRFEFPSRWVSFRPWILVPALTVIFTGGVIAGSSPQTRLPGPYQAAAEESSIDNQVIGTGNWAATTLGLDNRMIADRTLTNVMGSYGGQRLITNLSDNVSVSGVFLKYNLTSDDCTLVANQKIQYLLVDKRITSALPILGFYFESWEQLIVKFPPPVNIAVLEKFDHLQGVSRLYDSGDIVIYDIGNLICAP
jgi:hypothetical protein